MARLRGNLIGHFVFGETLAYIDEISGGARSSGTTQTSEARRAVVYANFRGVGIRGKSDDANANF